MSKIKEILIVILIIVFGFDCLIHIFDIRFVEEPNIESGTKGLNITDKGLNITDICNGLATEETAECLVNYVNTFYKYRRNPDDNILTFEELKEQGGDCKDWSELYIKLGKENGFYVEEGYIQINDTLAHVFTIIANFSKEKSWCILSNNEYHCF